MNFPISFPAPGKTFSLTSLC